MEWRFFEEGAVPECTTLAWYASRERAPHLEQEGHRQRLEAAAQLVNEAHALWGVATVSDMGAGDGGLLSLLNPGIRGWGFDVLPANVEAARVERAVDVIYADVLTESVRYGDLCVCTEMLEHLIDPHAFVRQIPSEWVVASSPAYENEASHYEFHTWAWNMGGYAELFSQGGFIVERHFEAGGFQLLRALRRLP